MSLKPYFPPLLLNDLITASTNSKTCLNLSAVQKMKSFQGNGVSSRTASMSMINVFRGVFKSLLNIYDEALLQKYLKSINCFHKKSCIIDV